MNMTAKEIELEHNATEQRARDLYEARRDDLKEIFKRMDSTDEETADEAMSEWHNYGLSFDYIEPFTYDDQRDGYYCFLISWGGPSEELRAWFDSDDQLRALEFVYLNWGECAKIDVIDCPTMRQAIEWNYDLMK